MYLNIYTLMYAYVYTSDSPRSHSLSNHITKFIPLALMLKCNCTLMVIKLQLN